MSDFLFFYLATLYGFWIGYRLRPWIEKVRATKPDAEPKP